MRNWGALLLLAGLAACADDGAGTAPNIKGGSGAGGGTGVLSGTVSIITQAPDSQITAFKDVQVTLIRTGDVPPDSTPPDNPPPPPPPPGDTMLTLRQGALFAPVFLSDTVVPPPPPPPPPPAGCPDGDVVATATTNAAGQYLVNQLEPGLYTIRFEPPPASGVSPRETCSIAVRSGPPTVVDVFLPAGS